MFHFKNYFENLSIKMSCNKLQAAFAKRREAEQIKIEQTTAVDKYFDKWDRITSRYSHTQTQYFIVFTNSFICVLPTDTSNGQRSTNKRTKPIVANNKSKSKPNR